MVKKEILSEIGVREIEEVGVFWHVLRQILVKFAPFPPCFEVISLSFRAKFWPKSPPAKGTTSRGEKGKGICARALVWVVYV